MLETINPRKLLKETNGRQKLKQLLRDRARYDVKDEHLDELASGILMRQSMLCEGYRGAGKTDLAESLAYACNLPRFFLPCVEDLSLGDVLFEWDRDEQREFVSEAIQSGKTLQEARLEKWSKEFLVLGPVLDAFNYAASNRKLCILIIDEIDKAQRKLMNFMLQILGFGYADIPRLKPNPQIGFTKQYSIAERNEFFPIVVATSNAETPLPIPLRSRFRYIYFPVPEPRDEVSILHLKCPEASRQLIIETANLMEAIRHIPTITDKPGIRESLNLLQTCIEFGVNKITPDFLASQAGCLIKDAENLVNFRSALKARIPAALLSPSRQIVEWVDELFNSEQKTKSAARVSFVIGGGNGNGNSQTIITKI